MVLSSHRNTTVEEIPLFLVTNGVAQTEYQIIHTHSLFNSSGSQDHARILKIHKDHERWTKERTHQPMGEGCTLLHSCALKIHYHLRYSAMSDAPGPCRCRPDHRLAWKLGAEMQRDLEIRCNQQGSIRIWGLSPKCRRSHAHCQTPKPLSRNAET